MIRPDLPMTGQNTGGPSPTGHPPGVRALVEAVTLEHREWVDANPDASLGDLRARIEAAVRQCETYALAGDPAIADRAGVPEPLSEELALWPSAASCDGAPRHFSDAGALLAGYAWRLVVLERLLGCGFPLSELARRREESGGG